MEVKRNVCGVLVRKPVCNRLFQRPRLWEWVIPKWILKKYDGRVWIGLI
jgi:hypothetical protein